MRKNEYIRVGSTELPYLKSNSYGHLLTITLVNAPDISEISKLDFSHIEKYNAGESKTGSYDGYSTIYRYTNGILQLSNDGSIYVEPRDHEYIVVGDNSYDVGSISQSGNILTIEFINDGVATEDLTSDNIDHYTVYRVKTGSFEGFNTVYKVEGRKVQLSNDGSIYREHDYIIAGDGDPIDIESVSQENSILIIKFLSVIDPSAVIGKEIVHYSSQNTESGRYSGFDTIYREDGLKLELSNDGSVYDPKKEAEEKLKEAKEKKIAELSKDCAEAINYGTDIDFNEETKHFRFTAEDQQNLKAAFDLAVATKMNVPYHADDEMCRLYTPEEIAKIYVAEQSNLTQQQTRFNQLKQMVLALESVEAVEAVLYTDELTGEYLETYNAMMAQTQAIIEALTSGLINQGNEGNEEEELNNEIG